MRGCGALENCASRIAGRQRRGNVSHAPRAAEIQTIEVNDLGVGSISHGCRSKQTPGLTGSKPWEKPIQPTLILTRLEHTKHQLCFHQRGREEVFAATFPRGRI